MGATTSFSIASCLCSQIFPNLRNDSRALLVSALYPATLYPAVSFYYPTTSTALGAQLPRPSSSCQHLPQVTQISANAAIIIFHGASGPAGSQHGSLCPSWGSGSFSCWSNCWYLLLAHAPEAVEFVIVEQEINTRCN